MHLFFLRPTRAKLLALIDRYQHTPVTCEKPGSMRGGTSPKELPTSAETGPFLWKSQRGPIGSGTSDFEAATAALQQAKCFELSWVSPIIAQDFSDGQTFCVMARAFGLWSVNFCRVVYVDWQKELLKETLAIGICTLPKHAAVGEERLAVTLDRATGQVGFSIASYSRPSTWLSRLFASYLSSRQDLFAKHAIARMSVEVAQTSTGQVG